MRMFGGMGFGGMGGGLGGKSGKQSFKFSSGGGGMPSFFSNFGSGGGSKGGFKWVWYIKDIFIYYLFTCFDLNILIVKIFKFKWI